MDEKNIEELLSEEIARQIKGLSEFASGSKEKSMAIDELATLYKLRIEENKSEWDADEKYNSRVADNEAKERDEKLKQRQNSLKNRLKIDISKLVLLEQSFCYH